jgi:hypothetical protein
MIGPKTFFEQIPVETVKLIAEEFPQKNPTGSDGGKSDKPDEVRSPLESWRELAQKVQHERDPQRMLALVEQLLSALDQEQLRKVPRMRDAGNSSD